MVEQTIDAVPTSLIATIVTSFVASLAIVVKILYELRQLKKEGFKHQKEMRDQETSDFETLNTRLQEAVDLLSLRMKRCEESRARQDKEIERFKEKIEEQAREIKKLQTELEYLRKSSEA